ncbi:MAG: hypothetical protein ACXVQZ_10015, partial [Gaiellaceae bacterium]
MVQLAPAAARGELRPLGDSARLDAEERARLVQRVRLLAWGGNAWHLVEFAVALGAGIAAASPALIGFSLDSLIELVAGFVIVWLFRVRSAHADERRAQQLVAASYAL